MTRFDAPGWRFAGSVVSWTAFAFFFLDLFQSASIVLGLGGYCASGGPYVIETECPDAVVAFTPLSIFGMLAAVAIAVIFARGFGVQLVGWAWPILFVGLGVGFFVGAAGGQGVVVNILLGVMFVVMGLAPVVLVVRAGGLAATLVGTVSLGGRRFAQTEGAPRYFGIAPMARADGEGSATGTDWLISLGLWIASVALGAWASVAAFAAVAGS